MSADLGALGALGVPEGALVGGADIAETETPPPPWRARRLRWEQMRDLHLLPQPDEDAGRCRAHYLLLAQVPRGAGRRWIWWGASRGCQIHEQCRAHALEERMGAWREHYEPLAGPNGSRPALVVTYITTTPEMRTALRPEHIPAANLAIRDAAVRVLRDLLRMPRTWSPSTLAFVHPAGDDERAWAPHFHVFAPALNEMEALVDERIRAEYLRRLRVEAHRVLCRIAGIPVAESRAPRVHGVVHEAAAVEHVVERELRTFPGWGACGLRLVYAGSWRRKVAPPRRDDIPPSFAPEVARAAVGLAPPDPELGEEEDLLMRLWRAAQVAERADREAALGGAPTAQVDWVVDAEGRVVGASLRYGAPSATSPWAPLEGLVPYPERPYAAVAHWDAVLRERLRDLDHERRRLGSAMPDAYAAGIEAMARDVEELRVPTASWQQRWCAAALRGDAAALWGGRAPPPADQPRRRRRREESGPPLCVCALVPANQVRWLVAQLRRIATPALEEEEEEEEAATG